jgi:hypothetical protein
MLTLVYWIYNLQQDQTMQRSVLSTSTLTTGNFANFEFAKLRFDSPVGTSSRQARAESKSLFEKL